MKHLGWLLLTSLAWAASPDLEEARNQQSVEAAEKIAQARRVTAGARPQDSLAQYETAQAYSYAAEVA